MRNMRKSPRQGIVCLRKIERFSNSTLLLELPQGSGLSGTVRSRELGQKRWTYIFSCASLLKRPIFTYSSSQKKWFRFEPIINADPFSLITANKQRWCLTTLMHRDNIMLRQSISFCCYLEVAVVAIFWIGNRSSRPRVILPEVAQNLSHVARNFSNVARKKKSSRPKKQILKRSEFQTVNRQ